MPAHLASISRRQFIRNALILAGGVGIAPSLFAKAKRQDPDSWALLSDTHILADPLAKARGINMTDHFRRVSKQLLGLERNPAGVIISGDLAFNSGFVADYSAFSGLLQPIRAAGMPVHLLFGNHDNRERFAEVFSEEKSTLLKGRKVELVRGKHVNWFLLDSLVKTNSTPGLLGEEQLEWLARTLDSNQKQPAMIVMHHNPEQEKGGGLNDTAALMDVIRHRGQVKAVVYGHSHKWKVQQDPGGSGLHLINLPAVSYVFHEDDPAGWVQATTTKKGVTLQLRTVNPDHQLNGQKVSLEWRKA